VAKSKKPHTIAEKNYYWTSYTSKQYAITLNKLSLFFSSKLYVILFDLYCLFSFKCFKSLIVGDSLSVLLAMSTGNWKQHSFANNMFVSASIFEHWVMKLFCGFQDTVMYQETKY